MTNEEIAERHYALRSDLERGLRYYGAMRNRCSLLAFVLQSVIALSASASFAALLADLSPALQKGLALVAAAASLLSLAERSGKRADAYARKRARFSEILRQLPVDYAEWTVGTLTQLTRERLEVEADEGPLYECLDVVCHNQQCLADGRPDEIRPLSWWQEYVLRFLPVRYKPPAHSSAARSPQCP